MHYLRGSVLPFHKYKDIMKVANALKKEGNEITKTNNTVSLNIAQILRHVHKLKYKPTKEKKM